MPHPLVDKNGKPIPKKKKPKKKAKKHTHRPMMSQQNLFPRPGDMQQQYAYNPYLSRTNGGGNPSFTHWRTEMPVNTNSQSQFQTQNLIDKLADLPEKIASIYANQKQQPNYHYHSFNANRSQPNINPHDDPHPVFNPPPTNYQNNDPIVLGNGEEYMVDEGDAETDNDDDDEMFQIANEGYAMDDIDEVPYRRIPDIHIEPEIPEQIAEVPKIENQDPLIQEATEEEQKEAETPRIKYDDQDDAEEVATIPDSAKRLGRPYGSLTDPIKVDDHGYNHKHYTYFERQYRALPGNEKMGKGKIAYSALRNFAQTLPNDDPAWEGKGRPIPKKSASTPKKDT